MNNFDRNDNDSQGNIYFYRPTLPRVDTRHKFEITNEGDKLRVKNKNVNVLFSNLTSTYFDELYNDFNHHLNLDLDPLTMGDKKIMLSQKETEKLVETIITRWIYYYTINNLKVKVDRSDFTHPYMVDYVLTILDKKLGVDTPEALSLGAKLLRQDLSEYKKTVASRRLYYDR